MQAATQRTREGEQAAVLVEGAKCCWPRHVRPRSDSTYWEFGYDKFWQ
jgi:hypothetical protein